MYYLCSRRAISANAKHFTAAPGAQSSFVRTQQPRQPATPAHRISAQTWAREVLAQSRNDQVLLVIHGFRIQQNTFLNEVAVIQSRLRHQFRGAVVGLDWPTNGRLSDYVKDHRDARATALPLLRDAVDALFSVKPTVKLHILGHSMACHLISVALQEALGTPLERRLRSALRTIAVTAPDLNRAWTDARHPFMGALGRTCRKFDVHFSQDDEVLHLSEDLYHGGRKRLGRDGPVSPTTSILSATDWSQHYRTTYRNPFDIQKSHSWYYRDDAFYQQLASSLA